jgi:hypothetical protein
MNDFFFFEKGPIRIMSAVGLYRKRERESRCPAYYTNPLKAYERVQMFLPTTPAARSALSPFFLSSFFFKQRIIIS